MLWYQQTVFKEIYLKNILKYFFHFSFIFICLRGHGVWTDRAVDGKYNH